MKPHRKLTRRSFLGQVAGGAVLAGGALALVEGRASAQTTDSDPTDLPGLGRGGGRTTDRDTGPGADPIGRGRGSAPRQAVCSDSDAGDPQGRGRRCHRYANDIDDRGMDREPPRTGITDNDRGSPNADMEGRGRGGPGNRPQTGYTDHDPSDPAGNGRGGAGGPPYTGHTDADPGDRAGYGRGGSRRCTDADTGSYADAAGRGRFCPR